MPRADEPHIDTGALGLALGMSTPGNAKKYGPQELNKLYKVWFDTGVVLFVPEAMFLNMRLHLKEAD